MDRIFVALCVAAMCGCADSHNDGRDSGATGDGGAGVLCSASLGGVSLTYSRENAGPVGDALCEVGDASVIGAANGGLGCCLKGLCLSYSPAARSVTVTEVATGETFTLPCVAD